MKFNINDTVRVRLTDYGRAVLRDDWQSTTNIYYARPEQRAIRGEYKPPKEDEHGWSEWQLWALMEAFGEHTGMGSRLSFETEIEISSADLAKATAERDDARTLFCMNHPLVVSGDNEARDVARRHGWDCFDAEGDKTC